MIGSDYLELPATWDRGQRSRWVRTGQISTLPRPWTLGTWKWARRRLAGCIGDGSTTEPRTGRTPWGMSGA
jgi:hypothetical protein